MIFCLFVDFANLIQVGIIWEEEASVEELFPADWPVDKSVGHFLD